MTEKRFIDGGEECIEDQFLIDTSNDKNYWVSDGLDGIVELLNTLNDENEQLKQINRNLGDFREYITEQNVLNEKQRKELQLQLLRLYNYFENWFEDTMSPNAFSEMWDNVKEDEKWEKVV